MNDSSISIQKIIDGIHDCLQGISIFKQMQNTDELTEAIPETPSAQIYFESKELGSKNVDKLTFNSPGAIRQFIYTFHIDVYSRQRSNISTDMQATIAHVDLIDDILSQQNKSPYFNVKGIHAFTYKIERSFFDYGGYKFVGSRFVLSLTVY